MQGCVPYDDSKSSLRVGILQNAIPSSLISVRTFMEATYRAVAEQFDSHVCVYDPTENVCSRQNALRRLYETSDVIFGRNAELLEIRDLTGSYVPIVFHAHGELPYGGARIFANSALFRNDVVLVSSQADLRLFHAFYQSDQLTAQYLPFSVDTNEFRPPSAMERQRSRRRFGINASTLLLVYAGRLIPHKNVHLLIHLFCWLRQRGLSLQMVVAGKADKEAGCAIDFDIRDYSEYLKDLCHRLGVKQSVFFLEALDRADLPEVYGMADLFVNLTTHHDENFGLAQVEAMACGLPVIGTRWGGLGDSIEHGVNGFSCGIIPTPTGPRVPWRVAARYIERLLRDEVLRQKLSLGARKAAVRRFSFARFKERMNAAVRFAATRTTNSFNDAKTSSDAMPGVTQAARNLIIWDLAARWRSDRLSQAPKDSLGPIFQREIDSFFSSDRFKASYIWFQETYGEPITSTHDVLPGSVPFFPCETRITGEIEYAVLVDDLVAPRSFPCNATEMALLSQVDGHQSVEEIEAVLGKGRVSVATWERLVALNIISLDNGETSPVGGLKGETFPAHFGAGNGS